MDSSFSWGLWEANSNALVVLIIATVIWSWRSRTTSVRGAWWIAVLSGVVLLCSPIHANAMNSYPAHMSEHLIVILIIVPIGLWALSPGPVSPLVSMGGFLSYVALVPLYHLTSLGALIMRSTGAHDVEIVVFALVGGFFWLGPLGSSFSKAQRITYIAMSLPVSIFTGLALMSMDRIPFSLEAWQPHEAVMRGLHRGGLFMAIGSTMILAGHLTWSALPLSRERLAA